jgi:rare lipoprotein A
MCVQKSVRVGFVVVAGLAANAASDASKAQSLTDALAGPASRAVSMGTWKTKTARVSAFKSWRPTVSVTLTPPPKQIAATATLQKPPHPYGLHGPIPSAFRHAMTGLASYYGSGERTATGERFDPSGMTAAHRTLPFGTRVRVTRVDTGDSVVVRINDRGPFKPGRVIDLSEGAARNLGMMGAGLASVRLEVVNNETGSTGEAGLNPTARRSDKSAQAELPER